jgi:transposase
MVATTLGWTFDVRTKSLRLPTPQSAQPRRTASVDHAWLTDAEWAALSPFLMERPVRRGRPPGDHRRVLNAILWVARSGAPWRELPADLGNWNSVFRQYRRWTRSGVWDKAAASLAPSGTAVAADDRLHAPMPLPGQVPAILSLIRSIGERPNFVPERMGRRRKPGPIQSRDAS